ncbi:putative RNA-directed DNA polymerase [Tanacetum coccineum]
MIYEDLTTAGLEVCVAIRDLFSNGQILREINHTFLALIPKVPTPLRINDYRLISCCNVIYKCISKVLTNRIIEGIKEVVSANQSAFIPGRNISDNILTTQEFMHKYHRKRGNILKGFGFHHTMIKWVMACVTTASFSISINGDINGFFKGKRGLRQGEPLSPYLFTLVMEILTLMLKMRVTLSESFRYHKHCEKIHIINVCFADDLFLFAHGDVDSVRVIMESLDEFKSTSGLVLSIPKITTFFGNVTNYVKTTILSIMSFSKGKLPIKYLGVLLISSRLLNRDCKILVESAKNIIDDWKNNSLSFAGRLQLCKSIISSMHVYWASVLAIPKGILYDIQALIQGFLWCNGEYKCGKAKVAWDSLCLPTKESGLGLRSLELFNKALMTKHIWNIVTNKESQWVGWIQAHKLKASAWYDTWDTQCPLIYRLSPRDISREGYNLQSYVANLVLNRGYSAQVWSYVRNLADMDAVPPSINAIVSHLLPLAKTRTTKGVFGKMLLAASSYYIWIERNNHLFKNAKRTPGELRDIIMVMVHLKLMTFRFKNTSMVNRLC